MIGQRGRARPISPSPPAGPATSAPPPGGETARAAWARLRAARTPIYLDVPVLARKVPERSGPSRLALDLYAEDGARLGRARVYPGEWYPGASTSRFSHYFLVLQRAYAGLEAEGRPPRLRLQVLKAVNAGRTEPFVVLLKFVIAPEFAVAGGRLERLYQCPLAAYYQHFLGVARDVRRDATAPSFAAGRAIHRGYQRAAQSWARLRDAAAAQAEYDRAVLRAWSDDFAYYLLDPPRRPTRLYTLPIQAGPTLVARLAARWPHGAARLYQERLFYSPSRGLVGRADRIVEASTEYPVLSTESDPEPSAISDQPPADTTQYSALSAQYSRELYELKTTGYAADRDPLTGRQAPGGVQAVAYHEILRSLDGEPPRTYVEIVAPEGVEAVPLPAHPVVTRAEADVGLPLAGATAPASQARATGRDRYLDLVAQARNVAYVVESGLLTGYDRYRIDELAKYGPRLRGVGGDFALYGAAPPCRACAVQARGLCEEARYYAEPPWRDFFRHVPARLYRYWSWLHHQLQAEERAVREHLYHLTTTPLARLESEEGISLGDLALDSQVGLVARLSRAARLETRLREDDRVLVTPQDVPPGEVQSVEGVVRALGETWIEIEVRDELAAVETPPAANGSTVPSPAANGSAGALPAASDLAAAPPRYRVDQLGYWEGSGWQAEGLTDFLVGAMQAAAARGRALRLDELPPLARLLLGDEPPRSLSTGQSPDSPLPLGEGSGESASPRLAQVRGDGAAAPALNSAQQQALEAALALGPGDLLLIQGPPGTGKTALIARLVREVVLRDFLPRATAPAAASARSGEETRPILLLANTHRACNELVRKLHDQWPDLRPFLVRLGPANAAMEPEVRQYVLAERLRVREQLDSVALRAGGVDTFLRLVRQGALLREQAAVFVGTLASAARPELRGLTFSYVVVDECGQATEPAALQALRHLPRGYAGRLVLVGDHRQLPPVVPPTAADGEPAMSPPPELEPAGFRPGDSLRTSLFERLARRYPARLITLAEQYRMCGPVCHLVSETFYGGAVRPASAAVAEQRLVTAARALADPWAAVWDPARPIVFVDTRDDPAARDTQVRFAGDEARDNPREAALLAALLAALFRALPEAAAADLAAATGIISPYRRQNNRLRQELRARLGPLADLLRVDTVDRFQGGERTLVAISLVASNAQRSIGPLHADWRRMNVAISRARAKLLLVGDRATLTLPGPPPADPAEAAAKERYAALFATLDGQAARGDALILSSEMLSDQ